MLKRTLIIFFLALSQFGCPAGHEGGSMFQPAPLSPESRQGYEWVKRKFLEIQDLKIGDGPIAAWGRKVEADIDVRYIDRTLIYSGPAYAYAGMGGDVMIHNNLRKPGALSLQQTGIILGLNGMAVGGKRQFTVYPRLVCEGYGAEQANPRITCLLVIGGKNNTSVRKEPLIVEATLTASCIPLLTRIPFFNGESGCRDSEVPRRDPSAPIWHFYYAEPSHS